MTSPWRSSPRDVDLLSWFTSPMVPLVFGGIATSFGIVITILISDNSWRLLLGMVALAVWVIAFWTVAYLVSPLRLRGPNIISVVPISIGWIALLISFASQWQSTVPFELRWTPIGLGMLIATLAPYLSALRILVVGSVSSLVTMTLTFLSLTVEPHPSYWPPLVAVLLGGALILVATAGSMVFSYQVVARTLAWATSGMGPTVSSGVLGEAAKRRILHQELASVSERTLPLLTRVTETGKVTPADREEAAALAESLRAELVERSNRSWLESLTRRMNLTVIDRERLAEQMDPTQRSALLGLLTAATDEFATATARLVIELRSEADGATAVAISADVALPEGRRVTLLAPYYVSLVASVDHVEWQSGEKLRLSFRVPPLTPPPVKNSRRPRPRPRP